MHCISLMLDEKCMTVHVGCHSVDYLVDYPSPDGRNEFKTAAFLERNCCHYNLPCSEQFGIAELIRRFESVLVVVSDLACACP